MALAEGKARRISREEVEHVAWLAKIELSEDEVELFAEQLSKVLEYFEKINELDTEGVPPTFHVHGLANVFREDEPGGTLSQEEALANAPRKEGGYIKAPRMV